MNDLRQLMQNHFLSYASYVILERAIPSVVDGLKPVQRRILHTLWTIDDGKFQKVANVAGQTMVYHPHGDAAITDALTTMAMKGYLLDMQGNFGNLYTGDPAAASRYIEARLSSLAKETMFNYEITEMIPSYDGRRNEPVTLPAKIPLLLIHGAEGIAVGMSTRILPHNFIELLKAEMAILEGKPSNVLPDFPTGGIMDASEYDGGKGKVKLRAKIDIVDPKTIVIRQICYGTTTESLIRSIDEAAKKGKIKIDSINDYTADKVEIEIKLPRGQYAEDLINALYAFTECEVSLSSQVVVIKDNLPWETDVNRILNDHSERLKEYLKQEFEIERNHLLEKIFARTLEQIFIENRLYKKIETIKSQDQIHKTVETSLKPYHKELMRTPTHEDRERLLSIPIRRISRFDIDRNQDEIAACHKRLKQVEKMLKNIKQAALHYLQSLIDKYEKTFPRLTKSKEIEEIDKRAVATKQVRVRYDSASGFIGTKVNSGETLECTNFDKILIFSEDGTYRVMNVPEKEYVTKPIHVAIADKETVFSVLYKDLKTHLVYAKRFIVKQFILDKEYRYFEEGYKLELLSSDQALEVTLRFIPKLRQKVSKQTFSFKGAAVKGVSAKGIKVSSQGVKKVVV